MKGMNRTENDQHISSGLPEVTDKIHKGDAALEFIKHVCAVLALDQNVQHDVLVILVHLAPYSVNHFPTQSIMLSLMQRNISAVCLASSYLQRNLVIRWFI
jgi:hypothetical protein